LTGKTEISIVIPAYNEEENIEKCFNEVSNVLREYSYVFEVILEEDGSTDRTPEVIDSLAEKYSYVTALHSNKRGGKGFGIKKAMEVAKGEKLVLIDSDMEYSPEGIPTLLKSIGQYDIVIGFRGKGGREGYRVVLSRLHSVAMRLLFGVDLQDIQSGIKIFKREVIEEIKPIVSDGFEFDSEVVVKALRRGYKVSYVPVSYHYKGRSKVSLMDPIKMFISLLRLRDEMFRGE
jgi:glycosyltransferase involved in cell wall biosynthesis